MASTKIQKLPARDEVDLADTWDLSSLFADDEAWEAAFRKWERRISGFERFRGKLGQDAASLAACLKFDCDFDRLGERLGGYAHLKATEDQANSRYQALVARFQNVATRASQAASYIRPEILAIPAAKMSQLLEAKELKPFRLVLQRILRFKKHTLGKKEEELLAMQGEMAQRPARRSGSCTTRT